MNQLCQIVLQRAKPNVAYLLFLLRKLFKSTLENTWKKTKRFLDILIGSFLSTKQSNLSKTISQNDESFDYTKLVLTSSIPCIGLKNSKI